MAIKIHAAMTLAALAALTAGAIDHPGATTDRLAPDRFTLVENGRPAVRIVVESDEPAVRIAAANLDADFERVTGEKTPPNSRRSIVVRIDPALKGKREQYVMRVAKDTIVVSGSDRRGAVYGIYELSEQLGVPPWYDWADAPLRWKAKNGEKLSLSIKRGTYTNGEPAVRYRGIFLNDEAPCLTGWVKNTYGTDFGDHRFYARVGELVLRLRGNFIWPAMWCWAFYADDHENSKTLDAMGVIVGTSHHEPMARNHQEYARRRKEIGPWNYRTNKDALDKFFAEGVRRMKTTEDVVTIGMRGDGDVEMDGNGDMELMIGTNNGTGEPPEETAAQIRAALREIRARQPQAKILLCPILPRGTPDSVERGKNDAVNELLKPLADGKTIVWTDWSGFFTLDDGRLTPGLNDDGLHPNAKGYAEWAKVALPVWKAACEFGRAGVPPPAADGDGTPSLPRLKSVSSHAVAIEANRFAKADAPKGFRWEFIPGLGYGEGAMEVVIDRVGVRTDHADEFRAPRLGVVCETPAQARPGVAKSRAWEQSLLTGNGAMGAMVPGELAHEEMFLSHARLFLPRVMNGSYFELGKYRDRARELALAGREKEIWDEVIQKASDESGYSFKRDPFMGAVSLVVDTPDLPKWSDAQGYRRMTDFERGECTVRTDDYERRIFASRTDGVIAMRVKDAKSRPFTVGFETISNGRPSGDAAIQRIREKDGYMYYRVDFRKENGKNPFHGYEAVGLRRGDEVFVKIYPLPLGTDSMFETAKRELSAAADTGYARLLERHAPVMKELMGRVTLDLPDRDLVRKFHAGRYNIISSTGPDGVLPNLQGLWAGSWSAPYNGSYTVDGNMPCAMSFWTRGNTPEFNESLYEWIMRYYDDFREAAKKGYNARGIHIPGQVTTTGLETAYYRNVELMWWHGGAGWMTGYLWRWYEATQDIEVLKKVYPLLKDAADYICDCMEEMPDGTLGFAPGYSPENAPHGDFRSQGDVMNPDLPKGGYSTQNNPTMDISVAKQSIDYATKAAKILKRDEGSVREWAQKRARLPKYAVSKDGFWAEWLIPGTPDNNSHRHVSHVFALYDEAPAEILTNAAFVAAIRKTLDARMTFHEKENHMAFGVTQIGYAAAKVGDAAVMERAIKLLQETYFTDALGTLHDPGWLFNIDISGGFPGIIADALITKGPDGGFQVLNAKPASWKKGSISGLLLPGGIKVKNLSWQGDSYELELLHPDGRITVQRK